MRHGLGATRVGRVHRDLRRVVLPLCSVLLDMAAQWRGAHVLSSLLVQTLDGEYGCHAASARLAVGLAFAKPRHRYDLRLPGIDRHFQW